MLEITAAHVDEYKSVVFATLESGTASVYAVPWMPGREPATRIPQLLGQITPAQGELTLTGDDLDVDRWYDLLAVAADGSVSNVIRHALRRLDSRFSVDVVWHRTEEHVDGRTVAYRISAEAVDAKNMGEDIFLFERQPFCDDNTLFRDVFIAVCKPADLDYYPTGAPAASGTADYPYFRRPSVDFLFKNRDLAFETMDLIRSDVQMLLNGLETLRIMPPSSIDTFQGVAKR